jgi:hypothetical protein
MSLVVQRQLVCRANKLLLSCADCLEIMGVSNTLSSKGLFRPVMVYIYLYLYRTVNTLRLGYTN